ncbi:SPOR domain-containing protein [Marinimicrobium sp. ARAG 43.8]|uniref:SPOR domain-containing protein n=1 Tax=Marinimicrobium sp. ARAG 43.8 TaxID=3418719 RepID=UPI003CEE9F64
MNIGLKQRLVGAVVLLAVAVLVLPSFLRDRQVEPVSTKTLIPDRPPTQTLTFQSPQAPSDIEPAPEPDTMFMPKSDQVPVEPVASEEVAASDDAVESETDADASVPPQGEDSSEQPPAAAGESAWVVQVISYRSADSARTLRDRLQAEGHRAYVRTATVGDAQVSRVYIGPKISRSDAEATKAEVDRLLKVDALIMRFEP